MLSEKNKSMRLPFSADGDVLRATGNKFIQVKIPGQRKHVLHTHI